MFRKCLILILTVLVINLSLSASVFAGNGNDAKLAKHAEKVKVNVAKLGTGKDAQIEVKLRDKTKLKGYVGQINKNSFVVIDEKTGASTEVQYSNAKQVKGNNLSTGVKIAIGVGILVAILVVLYVLGGSE